MGTTHAPAKAQQGYPAGKRYTGTVAKLPVGAHVAAYAAKLPTAQRTAFYCLPASQQAATAGCATYAQQYQYRQWLRTSGARANGHWGVPGSQGAKVGKAPSAHQAAAKLAKAARQGGGQAKRQAKAAKAAPATAPVPATGQAAGTVPPVAPAGS